MCVVGARAIEVLGGLRKVFATVLDVRRPSLILHSTLLAVMSPKLHSTVLVLALLGLLLVVSASASGTTAVFVLPSFASLV